MTITAKDLLGGWRLESWSFVYDDGRPEEFPLGREAQGLILYTPEGQVEIGNRQSLPPTSAFSRGTSCCN